MNKHTKLLVSVLFVVIIILAVGIARFYMSVSGNTGSSNETTQIIRKLDIDDSGNRIYEGEGSLYGVVDSNDRVIVAPEWAELSFADGSCCIASKRIGGRLLTGCIDYEGNIVVPFIYRNITPHESDGFVFYTAEADSDGSCVVYDSSFKPCFMEAWEDCSVTDEVLTLSDGSNSFTYTYGENGLVCSRADVTGQALGCGFTMNLYSRVLLSKLSCDMLENISDGVSDYLTFAYTGDRTALPSSAQQPVLAMLFPEDSRIITRKLLGVSDIFIYSEKTEGNKKYYAVSVVADTEISYIGSDDALKTLTDKYKAVIRFEISDYGKVTMMSGSFIKPEPDYPAENPEGAADGPNGENTASSELQQQS